MSQPLWYLRQQDRVIGPFPVPQIREALRNGEITPDWLISLDQEDWLSIRESGQFDDLEGSVPPAADAEHQLWLQERQQARERWLGEGAGIDMAQPQDLDRQRQAQQALAQDLARTDALLRIGRERRPPLRAGLLALLVLVGSIYLIWQGQKGRTDIETGIDLKAQCNAPLAEAVNWDACDKRGLVAPGVVARNARMARINLEGAQMAGADLSYGNMVGANLRNANLQGLRLSGADLTGADLSGSDLTRADLRYAVLRHAFLNGVRLRETQLGNAVWSDGHVCPAEAVGGCP